MTDILDLIGGKLTDEQVNSLLDILNSEGKNIEINSDGTFETKIGHTYVVESSTDEVLITNENDSPLCELIPAGQVGFVANTTISKTSSLNCTITEVFKLASLIQMGGGGISISELPDGYLSAEFLESDGMQWINIDYALYADSEVSVVAKRTGGSSGFSGGLVGANYNRNQYAIWFGINTETNVRWDLYGSSIHGGSFTINKTHELTKKGADNYLDGIKVITNKIPETLPSWIETKNTGLFCSSPSHFPNATFIGKIYKAKFQRGNIVGRNFIPSVSIIGTPAMFDKVSNLAFTNSGSGDFVVGLTLKQAKNLGKLSAEGGNLSISLPFNYIYDEDVINALSEAESKGWIFEYRTYDDTTSSSTASSSTYSLNRLFVKKIEDELGIYVSDNGTRYRIKWCEGVVGAEPETLGYEQFRSVEAACEYWGLTPYIDPTLEELTEN